MKALTFVVSVVVLVAVVLSVPRSLLYAQAAVPTENPVAVVSLGAVDTAAADVAKLLTAVGAADEAAAVQSFHKTMVAGVDWSRPCGVVVNASAGDFQTLAFLPVTDVGALLASPGLAMLGEPKPLADGVQQFDTPFGKSVFVKGQGGWAFVSDSADTLAALPADPLPLLGGLEEKYDVAVRVHVQQIPKEMRQMMLSGAASLPGGGLPGIPGPGPGPGPAGPGPAAPGAGADPAGPFGGEAAAPFGAAPASGPTGMLAPILDQVDELTIGLSIDGDTPKAVFDLSASGAEGSDLARRIAVLSGAKSDHSGLLLPDAALAVHLAVPLLKEDADALASLIEAAASQPAVQTPEEKELADLGKQLITATVRSAKLDGGVAVVNKPGASAFVYGSKAADAAALRTVMIDVVHKAQEQGGIPKDKFERIDYKGYRFVIVKGIKTPPGDDALRKMCGDEMEVTLALKEGDHYLATGLQTVELLKSVIDASEAGAQQPAAPVTVAVGLRSLLAAAQQWGEPGSVDPALVEHLKGIQGPDRVLLRLLPEGGGVTLRLEVPRAPLLLVVKQALEQVKNGLGAGGPGGPGGPGFPGGPGAPGGPGGKS